MKIALIIAAHIPFIAFGIFYVWHVLTRPPLLPPFKPRPDHKD